MIVVKRKQYFLLLALSLGMYEPVLHFSQIVLFPHHIWPAGVRTEQKEYFITLGMLHLNLADMNTAAELALNQWVFPQTEIPSKPQE